MTWPRRFSKRLWSLEASAMSDADSSDFRSAISTNDLASDMNPGVPVAFDKPAIVDVLEVSEVLHPEINNRTGRAALTWATSTLYTVITLLVAFITTPLLLKYLGQERLGANRAANEWLGYLSMIDLGITPALGVLMLRARAKRSASDTASVFRAGLLLMAVIGFVSAAAGLLLAGFMPQLVKVSDGLRHELIVSALLSNVIVLFLPAQLSRMLLEAEQRGYWINVALIFQSVTAVVLSVVLAKAGYGLVAQSAALVAGMVVATAIQIALSWRWYFIRPVAGPRFVTMSSIWRLGWPLALSGLGIRLNLMTDSLVVGYMMGPIAVFHLFVTQRAVSLFGGQINSAVGASWAALAELRLTGQQDAFVAGTLELTGLVVGVGTTLTGTVAAFNSDFVRLWVGAAHYAGDTLSYLTAAATVLIGMTTIYGFSLDSAGETAARIPVSIGGAVGNLLLSVLLVKLIGLPGVILGTLIACASSDAWFCPFLVSRRFGVNGRRITIAIAAGVLRGLPWVCATAVVAHCYHPRSWISFAIEAICVGTLSLAYAWIVVLTPKERQRWVARVSAKLPASLRARGFSQ